MEQKNREESDVQKTRKRSKIIIILVVCMLVIFTFIFYWRVAVYYQSHFFPNTRVNGFDCSNLDASQTTLLLDSRIQEYKLEVTGRVNELGETGVMGEIGAEDIHLQYVDTFSSVEHLLDQQNVWLWIEILTKKQYGHSLVQGVSYDEELLSAYLEGWDAFQNMAAPEDAYISEYSADKGCYEIVPEIKGSQFNRQEVLEIIGNAILAHETCVDLEELDCYAEASLKADDAVLNENVDTANKWLETRITYDWNGQEIVVDKERIHEWISFDRNVPQLDEEAVAEFVAEQAQELDTYGKNRKFMTTLGVELTLPSGAYGWKTDREGETEELLQLIYQGSILEKEPLYLSKGKQKGINDIGSSYVEADLTNQHLYLYSQGNLVLETDFVSGNPNKKNCATPAGVFGLTYKTTNAVLRGEDYETPVSYWMPFHGNFGMHDATWRRTFGGDIYLRNGSHGCINLPLDKAEEIYGYVSTGYPVICYYY